MLNVLSGQSQNLLRKKHFVKVWEYIEIVVFNRWKEMSARNVGTC